MNTENLNRPERIAIVDIETGGYHKTKNGLCEIGLIIMDKENGNIIEAFHWLIRPYQRRDPETKEILPELVSYKPDALAVNGLSEELLKQYGTSPEFVARAFEALLKVHRVKTAIGHNIKKFDNAWIEEFCDRFGTGFKFESLIDTLEMSKQKWNGLKTYSLQPLCKHLEIQTENAHRALGDCHATRILYMKLIA